jgi:hypothetical protein
MNNVSDWNGMILDRIKLLELKVDSLEAWRAWLVGSAAGLGLVAGLFAKTAAALFLK